MARTRYKIFDNDYPHFVTDTVVQHMPLFSNPEIVEIILDSLLFMQNNDRMLIYAYVIMENHMHMVVASSNLSKELGNFKSYTARKIIDHYRETKPGFLNVLSKSKQEFKFDRDHQFWQEGSHPKQIYNRDMMIQKIEYIHYNPVRRGYVDEPVHWRYSSVRNYEGMSGLLPVCTDWG